MLAAAALAAASTGCGGGDDEAAEPGATTAASTAAPAESTESVSTRPEPAPDQGRWAQQVDDACREWQERIDAVPAPTDAESLRSWSEATLPLVRKQLAAVKDVKPPSQAVQRRTAGLFLQALGDLEHGLTHFGAALRANDAGKVQTALTEVNQAGSKARTYATSLGLTECGGFDRD